MPTFTVLVGALIVSTMVYCHVLESATIYLRREKCDYRGIPLNSGTTTKFNKPCVQVRCKWNNTEVQRCPLVTLGNSRCQKKEVNKKGMYPECCPKLVCPPHHNDDIAASIDE
uniref:8.9 kDa family member n=1 Tax=Rhipicephalus zambeziensis TaxID=60191 RepID=A0A224YBZ6_9ACAR